MTESTVVFTKERNSAAAGRDLGARLKDGLSGQTPDAVILFASQHEYEPMLDAIQETSGARVLIGCSSAGEFVSGDRGEGSASAVALRSDVMRFTAGVGRNLRQDRHAAAAEIAGSFRGLTLHQYPHRAALVLADALAGYTDDFIYRGKEVPIHIQRMDMATGALTPSKDVVPAETAGVTDAAYVRVNPDGDAYTYSIERMLTDLYIVEGLH